MRNSILAAAMLAMMAPAAPAFADPPPWAQAHGKRAKDARHYEAHRVPHDRYRQVQSYRAQPRYDRYGRYVTPQRLDANDRVWRGNDGRYYCRRDNGTTGLIVGAAVGALLGRAIDGGQQRTVGTLLGAAGGALLGRSIDRGEVRCR